MARFSHRRGLQTMRTQSTRKAGETLTSPEMYIRLTSLEMERARRVVERERLIQRIQLLDERIGKIVIEQAEMKHRLDLNDQSQRLTAPITGTADRNQSAATANTYGLTY